MCDLVRPVTDSTHAGVGSAPVGPAPVGVTVARRTLVVTNFLSDTVQRIDLQRVPLGTPKR
jgi:hypothetical protein